MSRNNTGKSASRSAGRSRCVVVGGGAAGLMAAGRAAELGCEVLLLEKMNRTGLKIGISGKGRCNLTNSCGLDEFLDHFGRNGRFLRQCFGHFFNTELCEFFTRRGLELVTERGGRIFPASGRALDVVKLLNRYVAEQGVTIRKEAPVVRILCDENGQLIGVALADGEKISCDRLILATGGKSYPRTGSTGDGYRLLTEVGHSLEPIRPALVPLHCSPSQRDIVQGLAGLNLRNVGVRLFVDNKRKANEFGEIGFTETGLTGPVVLTLSGRIVDELQRGRKVALLLDLKPALDAAKLDNRLLRDLTERGGNGEPFPSILRGLLPAQLVPIALEACGIPEDVDTRNFPAGLRKRLVQWLKEFRIEISGYGSLDEAIVTAGGVSLKEIDPHTMESRLVRGLYVVGELLDLHGDTGGFNLQAAFSTGWLAASAVSADDSAAPEEE